MLSIKHYCYLKYMNLVVTLLEWVRIICPVLRKDELNFLIFGLSTQFTVSVCVFVCTYMHFK